MIPPDWYLSQTTEAQARSLAQSVARDLRVALSLRGTARLAVSGGRSPVPLLEALSLTPLPWSRITVTLVDERCVPPTSTHSNIALVRRHLLCHAAAQAHFLPPRADPCTIVEPADAMVLGMGTDGHTASLFSDAPELARALDPDQPPAYLTVTPASSPWPRITLNLSAIIQSGHVYLAITGAAKRRVLEDALSAGRDGPPIGIVLSAVTSRLSLYWCPDGSGRTRPPGATAESDEDQPH